MTRNRLLTGRGDYPSFTVVKVAKAEAKDETPRTRPFAIIVKSEKVWKREYTFKQIESE